MNEKRTYGQLDERPLVDGDFAFTGVNERLEPTLAPEGRVAEAKNMRFRKGAAETRLGQAICPWAKGSDGLTPFETPIRGGAVYSDPNGGEWFIIAADATVYVTAPHRTAEAIPLNGNTITGDVRFEQAFNKLFMFRGEGQSVLVMRNFTEGFQDVVQIESDAMAENGSKTIPESDSGLFMQNRLFIPFNFNGKKDFIAVGDIGNYSRYKFPQNAFRINEGSFDEIVSLAGFGRQSIVIFKGASIAIVDQLVPDAAGNYSSAYVDLVTDRHGLVARDGWTQYGRDIFYLSTDRTFTSLRLTEENKVTPGVQPLSAELENTFGRINWLHASKARVTHWNDYIFVAVPLDTARYLGPELADTTSQYSQTSPYAIGGLTLGETYWYEQGANDLYLNDPVPSVQLNGSGLRVAGTTTFQLYGTATSLATNTASLKHVIEEGVNTAILVYDAIAGAWAGHDIADGITMVKDWLKANYFGQERLFYISADGLIRLMDEGYQDEVLETVATPYTDLVALDGHPGSPIVGVTALETFDVNGGTTVKPQGSNIVNQAAVAEDWGSSWTIAGDNLWRDSAGAGGYDPTATSPWTSPNATATQINHGVRFTATNGVLPAVTMLDASGFYLEEHDGTEIARQDIECEFVTRGFPCQDADRKRFKSIWAHIASWAASYRIFARVDGVSEETECEGGPFAFSRTDYLRGQGAAWSAANAASDHGDAYRGEYSVVLPDTGMQMSEGVQLTRHQEHDHRLAVNERGKHIQIRVTCTAGRIVLRKVKATANEGERSLGTFT